MVASVASTAMQPCFVALTAALAPGLMTPCTGMPGKASQSEGRAAEVAVLQAMTSILTSPCSTSLRAALSV